MKSKIVPLFNKNKESSQAEVKYSALLEKLMEPFALELKELEDVEIIFQFGITAWNFANMKMSLPKKEQPKVDEAISGQGFGADLMKRMIDAKVKNFKDYPNYIVDFQFKVVKKEPVLTVVTQTPEMYTETMLEAFENDDDDEVYYEEDEYDENYIDRFAIVVKPLQPYLDWCAQVGGDDEVIAETNTYLVGVEIPDLAVWLQKKYDKIFQFELGSFHEKKKNWPQKRTYKMFCEWFQVDLSSNIFDFEKRPVSKS